MLKISLVSAKRSLPLLVVSAIAVSAGMAQTSARHTATSTSPVPIYRNRLPGVLVTRMWDWTTDDWNGDDKPYQQARLAIDRFAAHQGYDKLLVRYKAQTRARPDDPLALFRWAYTAYQAMLTRNSTVARFHDLEGLQEAFYHTPSAHTYNYARTQFLVGEFYTPHREAVPVAKRLLAVNRNDYQVEYCLASTYLDDYVPAKIEDVLAICNHLKRLYPAKSSLYTLTGEAYVLWWYQDKQSSHAQGVVENYERYLQLAPPKDEFRKRAQGIIDEFKAKMN